MNIVKITWPIWAIQFAKIWSLLHLKIGTTKQTSCLIFENFIKNNKCKKRELFLKLYKITRCFNCQQYGHVGKLFKNETKCRHCASIHILVKCQITGLVRHKKCAVWKKNKTWLPKCGVKTKYKWQIETTYENCQKISQFKYFYHEQGKRKSEN